MNSNKIVPLIFHDVENHQVNKFNKLIKFLNKCHGFITPQEFQAIARGQQEITSHKFLLTFDDGFFSNYTISKQILEPLQIKAIFFLTTQFIGLDLRHKQQAFMRDNLQLHTLSKQQLQYKAPLCWSQIHELLGRGHSIGCHTHTHPNLAQLDDEAGLQREICQTGDYLQQKLSIPIVFFAFPFGDISSISDKSLNWAGKRYEYIFSGIRGKSCALVNGHKIYYRQSINLSRSYYLNLCEALGLFNFKHVNQRRQLHSLYDSRFI